MGFYKKTPSFDLGELNIENLFVTDFLPLASGTYVKVYLMGLLYSKEENTNYRFDNSVLASTLRLPLEDIHEAWTYWASKKLIVKHFHEDQSAYDVEFLSLREMFIQDNFISKSQAPSITASNNNAKFIKDNEIYKTLKDRIEKLVQTPLSYKDSQKINDFYSHYYKNPDIIYRAFEHTYIDRSIRNIKAVDTLLNSWLDQGLLTLEQVNDAIRSNDKRVKAYKEILKILGMSFRMANQAEKEAIDRWFDVYHFQAVDLYSLIKHFSKSTMNINFNYIETRLKDLVDKEILTFEQFKHMPLEQTKSTSQVENKTNATKSKKKQYTIERERTYSEDELEDMLLNKINSNTKKGN